MELNYLPSFCTACYGSNRTGERFMSICKEQQIHNFCHPNAIMTLKEYLMDYASETTKKTGEKLLLKEVDTLENETRKQAVLENLKKIENGERDFKF
jgi:2-iminoacetate synthase